MSEIVIRRMAADFFISYTRVDRDWAEWVAWQLEAAGYTTTLQAWDFTPGRDWVHAMQEAMKDARRTVAILSPDYLRSAHGEAEWRAAYAADPTGERGLLLPVRVRDCDPPGVLATRVFIDLAELDEPTAKGALLGGVNQGRAKPAVAPGFPGRASPAFPGTASAGDGPAGPQPLPDDAGHLQRLLSIHQRNVRILEAKDAAFAGATPVHLVTQLEDERAVVADLEQRLAEHRG